MSIKILECMFEEWIKTSQDCKLTLKAYDALWEKVSKIAPNKDLCEIDDLIAFLIFEKEKQAFKAGTVYGMRFAFNAINELDNKREEK